MSKKERLKPFFDRVKIIHRENRVPDNLSGVSFQEINVLTAHKGLGFLPPDNWGC